MDSRSGDGGLESTAALLRRVRTGEGGARDELVRRFLPAVRSWAHRQLPAALRDTSDTEDLVQFTLLRALEKVSTFEPRGPGAFAAYLRTILRNYVLDELRKRRHRPAVVNWEEDALERLPDRKHGEVPPEVMIGYRRALEQLPDEDQVAVVLRHELGFSHEEVASMLGLASPSAARMRVTRALQVLAESMDGRRG